MSHDYEQEFLSAGEDLLIRCIGALALALSFGMVAWACTL
jgi:hypothetical protein